MGGGWGTETEEPENMKHLLGGGGGRSTVFPAPAEARSAFGGSSLPSGWLHSPARSVRQFRLLGRSCARDAAQYLQARTGCSQIGVRWLDGSLDLRKPPAVRFRLRIVCSH